MWRWVGTVALALTAAFWLCGTNSTQPVGRGDPAAARAMTAVTTETFDPRHPDAVMPANWFSVMGYRPRVVIGPRDVPILIKPNGDCSSFTGRTEYDFTNVCKEHDLAYDIVRYATRIQAPMAPSGRQAADAMFGRELHARCDQLKLTGFHWGMCHTYAEGFVQVVKINSWRQGYRSPDPESNWRWSAMFLLAGGFLCLPAVFHRTRRRPHGPYGPADLLPGHPMRLAQPSADRVTHSLHGIA